MPKRKGRNVKGAGVRLLKNLGDHRDGIVDRRDYETALMHLDQILNPDLTRSKGRLVKKSNGRECYDRYYPELQQRPETLIDWKRRTGGH
jgi:hypothetical protein